MLEKSLFLFTLAFELMKFVEDMSESLLIGKFYARDCLKIGPTELYESIL